jgi:hypothetical protein
MLRLNTFNLKKNNKLNAVLKRGISVRIQIKYIQMKSSFDIIKDVYTSVYMIILKNIFVIHLDKLLLNDFEELYRGTDYKFKVFSCEKMFHVFCISKKSSEISENFLNGNESNEKYMNLYNLLKAHIIICNRKYNIVDSRYCFIKEIGDGEKNKVLNNELEGIILMVNNYMNFLPIHYLDI